MIPKIAFFHWSQNGRPMNWMRWASLRSFRLFNPDWDIRLIPTDADLLHLDPPHQADITWWRVLAGHGGFAVATDILFLRPIPEEWLTANHAMSLKEDNSTLLYTAMVGCEPSSEWAASLRDSAERTAHERGGFMAWCAVGVDIAPPAPAGTFNIPWSDLVGIPCHETHRFWCPGELNLEGDPVGIHWFGGQQPTMDSEPHAGPGSDMAIVRLAERILCGQ